MSSSLPALTLQPSFPPDCSAPPSGALVVDDVTHGPVRSDCTQQTTQGSFAFEFYSPDANGSYSAKVDLHQLGGGFNGHFYFSHMRKYPDSVNNVGNRLKITGRWTLGQQLHQWTRVWIHLPDHAAWTDQAAYTINFGNGQSQTRYLPQKRYENAWVPIGVFLIDGVPNVSLSNILTGLGKEDVDDVAWDAIGFQPLSAKPADFVVALGDSFSSGEGAWSYDAWSDHGGTSTNQSERNACHQSANAWIRKTTIPGRVNTIGALEAAGSSVLDFHFLACSGAETEQLLPFYSYSGPGSPPQNAEGQNGDLRQYGLVSQLDAGYLDSNTTMVTLTIGGNDMRFSEILSSCFMYSCGQTLAGDDVDMFDASEERLENEIPLSLAIVLNQIKTQAPNASIVLMGYPRLFDVGGGCIGMDPDDLPFLNGTSDGLRDVLEAAADDADSPGQRVLFVDPQPSFSGHTLCTSPSAINGLLEPFSPGDLPWGVWSDAQTPVAQSSVHPNNLGTDLYSDALEGALGEIYP